MRDTQKPCLIACGIFRPELERIVAHGTLPVDIDYLDPRLHNNPKSLENSLKRAIEKQKSSRKNRIVILYGDICMGFNNEMKALVDTSGVVKVDALNCIDCLLGGKGKLLDIDPTHAYFFLNPSWIDLEFGGRDMTRNIPEARKEFGMLTGLFLLDTLENLDAYSNKIEEIKQYTALPVVDRRNIGVEPFRRVILEALEHIGSKIGADGEGRPGVSSHPPFPPL